MASSKGKETIMLEFKPVTTYTRQQVKDALSQWNMGGEPPRAGHSLLIAFPGRIAIRITKPRGEAHFTIEMAMKD